MSEQLDKIDDYDAFVAQGDVRDFESRIAHWFGERCPDFDDTCPTCKAWKLYDGFAELMKPMIEP